LTIDKYIYHGEEIKKGLLDGTVNNAHVVGWQSDTMSE